MTSEGFATSGHTSFKTYKISWVKWGMDINITKMCKGSFTISKNYGSNNLCDIVDMDVCNLILGYPWKFDKGMWYDIHYNAYVVDCKRKKAMITSFQHWILLNK